MIRAMDRIGEHKGTGEKAGNHLAGHGRSGGETHIFGHMRLCPPPGLAGPVSWQAEAPVDQRMTPATGIACKHPDLAVPDPPCRAGILPPDPDGRPALLEKSGLVGDKHLVRIGKRLKRIPPGPANTDHPPTRSTGPAMTGCGKAAPARPLPPASSPSCASHPTEDRR